MAGIVGSLKALGKAVASSITTTKAKKNTDKKVDVGFNTRKSPATKIVYSRGTKRKNAAIDAILEARNNLNE